MELEGVPGNQFVNGWNLMPSIPRRGWDAGYPNNALPFYRRAGGNYRLGYHVGRERSQFG